MPSIKRQCSETGCGQIVESPARYCEKHQRDNAHTRQRKQFDKERADSPHRRMYGTARWKRLRQMKWAANPFCESGVICDPHNTGRRAPATDIHHRLGVQERPDLMWDFNNLESLCHACHSHFTALNEGFAKKKAA